MRPSGRKLDELREISLSTDVNKHAEGSCLVKYGDTHVICTASVDERLPTWVKDLGHGWVTAEYGMLPRSTGERSNREASRGKQGGRTMEIQRLIGRSLRASVDRVLLGERQVVIDCDVIQADGGTRCASITGGWVAFRLAINALISKGVISEDPIINHVAAVSCGIYAGQPVLDLDYLEDSDAGTDANFVITSDGTLVEVQASAEGSTFSKNELDLLIRLANTGTNLLIEKQKKAVKTIV